MESATAVGQEQHELAQPLQFPPGYRFVPLEVAAVRQQQQELAQQLQFPPGYRFTPTEQELIMDYLRNKIEGRQPPLAVVNEVAILDWQPGSLVEAYKAYGEHKWYFFTIREPSSSNKVDEPNRKVRVPGVTATWKATGSVVPIVVPAKGKQQEGVEEPVGDEEKIVVGTKRVLIYHSSDPEEDGKWSMHEYILNGHGKIGQYALCSIQRKQHSDTVDDAGEGTSSSKKSRRKRTKATDVDPGKTKKRKTNKKAASTQQEGMQLQQQEIAPIEAPLKPKSRTRKSATHRENKASEELVQAAEGQQQKQQHQEAPPFSTAVPSLTLPQQAPPQASQVEQKSLAAYAPPILPAVPLQGYPSLPDGMLGASAPMHHDEEDTIPRSFEWDDNDYMTFLENLRLSRNQDEQLASFTDNKVIVDSHAELQFYQSQGDLDLSGPFDQHVYTGQPQHLRSNTTLNDSSWNHGQHQVYYQQEVGGAFFGAPDQHANAQNYNQFFEPRECSYPLEPAGYYSSDQFVGTAQGENVAFGSPGDIGSLLADDDFDYTSVLRADDPEEWVGTQDEDGSNPEPEALQSQDELPWSCGQQKHTAANGHVCDGRAGYCSSDKFAESVQGDTVAPGSDGDMSLPADDIFAMSLLRDDGDLWTQDGSNPEAAEALQSQDEPLLCGQQQQQHTANGQRPMPTRCVFDFWKW